MKETMKKTVRDKQKLKVTSWLVKLTLIFLGKFKYERVWPNSTSVTVLKQFPFRLFPIIHTREVKFKFSC